MSDTPETPPKPKIGSLRDRIAAFESKPAANAPNAPPPPAPGPRPTRQWKPKPVDAPAQPSVSSGTESPERKVSATHSGMSASDARESIQRAGGSLKERMAALQGKGAFGPAGGAPPPPVAAKPREWKKPVVSPPPVEAEPKAATEGEAAKSPSPPTVAAADESKPADEASTAPTPVAQDDTATSPVEHAASPPAVSEAPVAEGEAEGDAPEKTEEELEAERRAAIAARMARLGGARVGMAPMFGGPKPKPAPKPSFHESDSGKETSEEPKPERIPVLPILPKVISPPLGEKKEDEHVTAEAEEAKQPDVTSPVSDTPAATEEAAAHPTASVASPSELHAEAPRLDAEHPEDATADAAPTQSSTDSAAPHPPKPISMPMPAAPRRAAPPRRNRAPPAPPAGGEEKLLDADQVAINEAEGVKQDLLAAKDVEGPQLGADTVPAVVESAEKEIKPEAEEDVAAPKEAPGHDEAAGEKVAVKEAEKVKEDLKAAEDVEKPDLGPSKPAEELVVVKAEEPEQTAHSEEPELSEQHEPAHADEGTSEIEHTASSEAALNKKEVDAEEPTLSADAPVAPEIPDSAIAPGGFSVHAEPSNEPGSVDNVASPISDSAPNPAEAEEEDEDEEAARRRRVAERMKKLGGVTFGMPVPAFPPKRGSTSSTAKDTPISPVTSEHAKPPAPILAHEINDEPEHEDEVEASAEAPVQDEETDDVKLENEEFPAGGKPLELPKREPTPEQPVEYHEEEVDHEEEMKAEEEKQAPPVPLPRRSLPPPPPPPVAHDEPAADEVDDSADVELENEQFPAGHDVDALDPEDAEEVVNYHEEEAGEEDVAPPPLPWHRPGRSLPPPPPPPAAHNEPESQPEEENDADEQENTPEDVNEVMVTHAEADAPALPAGESQKIIEQPVVEEETVADRSGAPVIALVNSEALVYDDDEPDPIDPAFYSPPSRQASFSSLPKVKIPTSQGPSPTLTTGPSAARVAEPAPAPVANPPAAPEQAEEDEEDEEQARRRTIAARMAKLGGLRFGVPPSLPPKRSAPPPPPEEEVATESEAVPEHEANEADKQEEDAAPTAEEDEYARRQAILARLVAGGGRGFGMGPTLAPPVPPPGMQRSVTEDRIADATEENAPNEDATADAEVDEPPPPPPRPQRAVPPPERQSTTESTSSIPPPPPARALPPVRPPAPSESEDDGEVVDGSESFEDVQAEEEEDAEEEEEVPPPPPPRVARTTLPPLPQEEIPPPLPAGRHSSSSAPGGRPPVPQAAPPPPPPTRDVPAPQRGGSGHSGFASVREAPRSASSKLQSPASQRDVSRERTLSPPRTYASPTETSLSQWELPEIPSSSLGLGETVNSLSSWSEDDTMYASAQAQAEPSAPAPPPKPITLPELDGDQLMALWGTVGTRVLQAASQLAEQSKRAVIGDGTGDGFVHAALDLVPSALKPLQPHVYGYLIFSMSGQHLQRRTSDIMEGDIAVITDAEFKGRKGLVPYHLTHVGTPQDPVVGVVHEFEPKNSKIRVLTAAGHANHYPTIESVSYKLDDLKHGSFKVYRVAQIPA